MATDKNLLSGNTTMLVLKLLEVKDMYGYQIIEELNQQSNSFFNLKTGTLYPLLHGLENSGMVTSYDQSTAGARVRRYYSITRNGKKFLSQKQQEWETYTNAVAMVLDGGVAYA